MITINTSPYHISLYTVAISMDIQSAVVGGATVFIPLDVVITNQIFKLPATHGRIVIESEH